MSGNCDNCRRFYNDNSDILLGMESVPELQALSHQERIDVAVEFLNSKDREPMAHLREELEEVISFTHRENAIEEVGDLLFTALRYVNSLLSEDAKIHLSEVVTYNNVKLGKRKNS
jgi:NTP pyrophosphatase (non-canonical NTP hydrolase)